MAPTIASAVVDRPAAELFAYATDPTRFHEWQQGVIDGQLEQPGPELIVRRQAHKEMPANVKALKRRVEAQQPQR
jgi:hypothetical protein